MYSLINFLIIIRSKMQSQLVNICNYLILCCLSNISDDML